MPPVESHQLPLFGPAAPADGGLPTSDRPCANCHGPLLEPDRHYHSRRPNDGAGAGFVQLICCNCGVNVFNSYCRIAAEAHAEQLSAARK